MSKKSSPTKPITPRVHALIDYAFAAGNLLLPRLLRLPGSVCGVFAAFGVVQGTLNAMTRHPYAARKIVPFGLHGAIEKSSAPIFIAAPLLAGAAGHRRSRWFWAVLGAALVTVYNLTDWDAKKTDR